VRRLNGWHRLWIASSVLYAGVVVAMIYLVDVNPKNAADMSRSQSTIGILDQYHSERKADLSLEERQNLILAKARVRRFLSEGEGPLADSYETFVSDINSTLNVPVNFSPAYMEHEQVLQEHQSTRLKVISYGFLGWVGPVIILYLLGFVIAWIRRGFQDNR